MNRRIKIREALIVELNVAAAAMTQQAGSAIDANDVADLALQIGLEVLLSTAEEIAASRAGKPRIDMAFGSMAHVH